MKILALILVAVSVLGPMAYGDSSEWVSEARFKEWCGLAVSYDEQTKESTWASDLTVGRLRFGNFKEAIEMIAFQADVQIQVMVQNRILNRKLVFVAKGPTEKVVKFCAGFLSFAQDNGVRF